MPTRLSGLSLKISATFPEPRPPNSCLVKNQDDQVFRHLDVRPMVPLDSFYGLSPYNLFIFYKSNGNIAIAKSQSQIHFIHS